MHIKSPDDVLITTSARGLGIELSYNDNKFIITKSDIEDFCIGLEWNPINNVDQLEYLRTYYEIDVDLYSYGAYHAYIDDYQFDYVQQCVHPSLKNNKYCTNYVENHKKIYAECVLGVIMNVMNRNKND